VRGAREAGPNGLEGGESGGLGVGGGGAPPPPKSFEPGASPLFTITIFLSHHPATTAMGDSPTYSKLPDDKLDGLMDGVASGLLQAHRVSKTKATAFDDAKVLAMARPLFHAIYDIPKKLTGGSGRKFLADFIAFVKKSTKESHASAHEISLLPEWMTRNTTSIRASSSASAAAAGDEEGRDDDDDGEEHVVDADVSAQSSAKKAVQGA
jgi:hypothetical protein